MAENMIKREITLPSGEEVVLEFNPGTSEEEIKSYENQYLSEKNIPWEEKSGGGAIGQLGTRNARMWEGIVSAPDKIGHALVTGPMDWLQEQITGKEVSTPRPPALGEEYFQRMQKVAGPPKTEWEKGAAKYGDLVVAAPFYAAGGAIPAMAGKGAMALGKQVGQMAPRLWGRGGQQALDYAARSGTARQTLQGVGQAMKTPFQAAPLATAGAELQSSALGAGAMSVLEDEGALAQTTGALLASMSPAVYGPLIKNSLKAVGTLATKISPTAYLAKKVVEGGKKLPNPLPPKGDRAWKRASDRVREAISEPYEEVAARIGPTREGVAPFAQAKDPWITTLGKNVQRETTGKMEIDTRDTVKKLIVKLESMGIRTGRLREFFTEKEARNIRMIGQKAEARRAKIRGTQESEIESAAHTKEIQELEIHAAVQKAVDDADDAVRRAVPALDQENASKIFREKLDFVNDLARTTEKEVFSAVPMQETMPNNISVTTYKKMMNPADPDFGVAKRSRDMFLPMEAKKYFDPQSGGYVGPQNTVQEMHSVRRQLQLVASRARSGEAPNEDLARNATHLANAILDDMRAAPNAGPAFDIARTFGHQRRTVFKQGPIGELLGYSRTGAKAVSPEATLPSKLGQGGWRGGEAAQRIREAQDFLPSQPENVVPAARAAEARIAAGEMQDVGEDFVTGMAVRSDFPEDFATKQQEILKRYPRAAGTVEDVLAKRREVAEWKTKGPEQTKIAGQEMRQMQTAINREAQEGVADVARREKAAMGGRKKGVRGRWAGADQYREMDDLMSVAEPGKAAASLMRKAGRKHSPEVRGEFMDWLIRKGEGVQGRQQGDVSGFQVKQAWDNPRTQDAAKWFFPGKAMRRRVEELIDLLVDEDMVKRSLGDFNVIADKPARVTELAAAWVGAQSGQKTGSGMGGTMQMASRGASAWVRWLSNYWNKEPKAIIIDAFKPENYRLLQALIDPKLADKARTTIIQEYTVRMNQVQSLYPLYAGEEE